MAMLIVVRSTSRTPRSSDRPSMHSVTSPQNNDHYCRIRVKNGLYFEVPGGSVPSQPGWNVLLSGCVPVYVGEADSYQPSRVSSSILQKLFRVFPTHQDDVVIFQYASTRRAASSRSGVARSPSASIFRSLAIARLSCCFAAILEKLLRGKHRQVDVFRLDSV